MIIKSLDELAAVEQPLLYSDCTLYLPSMFGVSQKLCRSVAIDLIEYAQYPQALRVQFISKGKRSARAQILEPEGAFALVLRRHSWPIQEVWTKAAASGASQTTRYTSYDKRWLEDFNAMIDKALENDEDILFDSRKVVEGK